VSRGWIALDLACVAIFAAIGRSVHDHGINVVGFAGTCLPFVAGLLAGWCLLAVLRWPGVRWRSGIVVTACTVTVGMCIRAVAGEGTAFAFILVALGFLGAAMLAWRLVLSAAVHLRARHAP